MAGRPVVRVPQAEVVPELVRGHRPRVGLEPHARRAYPGLPREAAGAAHVTHGEEVVVRGIEAGGVRRGARVVVQDHVAVGVVVRGVLRQHQHRRIGPVHLRHEVVAVGAHVVAHLGHLRVDRGEVGQRRLQLVGEAHADVEEGLGAGGVGRLRQRLGRDREAVAALVLVARLRHFQRVAFGLRAHPLDRAAHVHALPLRRQLRAGAAARVGFGEAAPGRALGAVEHAGRVLGHRHQAIDRHAVDRHRRQRAHADPASPGVGKEGFALDHHRGRAQRVAEHALAVARVRVFGMLGAGRAVVHLDPVGEQAQRVVAPFDARGDRVGQVRGAAVRARPAHRPAPDRCGSARPSRRDGPRPARPRGRDHRRWRPAPPRHGCAPTGRRPRRAPLRWHPARRPRPGRTRGPRPTRHIESCGAPQPPARTGAMAAPCGAAARRSTAIWRGRDRRRNRPDRRAGTRGLPASCRTAIIDRLMPAHARRPIRSTPHVRFLDRDRRRQAHPDRFPAGPVHRRARHRARQHRDQGRAGAGRRRRWRRQRSPDGLRAARQPGPGARAPGRHRRRHRDLGRRDHAQQGLRFRHEGDHARQRPDQGRFGLGGRGRWHGVDDQRPAHASGQPHGQQVRPRSPWSTTWPGTG